VFSHPIQMQAFPINVIPQRSPLGNPRWCALSLLACLIAVGCRNVSAAAPGANAPPVTAASTANACSWTELGREPLSAPHTGNMFIDIAQHASNGSSMVLAGPMTMVWPPAVDGRIQQPTINSMTGVLLEPGKAPSAIVPPRDLNKVMDLRVVALGDSAWLFLWEEVNDKNPRTPGRFVTGLWEGLYRAGRWENVSRIDVIDPSTIVMALSSVVRDARGDVYWVLPFRSRQHAVPTGFHVLRRHGETWSAHDVRTEPYVSGPVAFVDPVHGPIALISLSVATTRNGAFFEYPAIVSYKLFPGSAQQYVVAAVETGGVRQIVPLALGDQAYLGWVDTGFRMMPPASTLVAPNVGEAVVVDTATEVQVLGKHGRPFWFVLDASGGLDNTFIRIVTRDAMEGTYVRVGEVAVKFPYQFLVADASVDEIVIVGWEHDHPVVLTWIVRGRIDCRSRQPNESH
jgi:hypothetical protein